jgi:class 3 adenylate cyclase
MTTLQMISDQEVKDLEVKLKNSEKLPYIQEMETVVLFADISGFTKISEACAK